MDDRTLIAALAIAVVASRLLHKRLRTTTLRKLAKGEDHIAFAKSFETDGKLDKLRSAAKQTGIPWMPKPWLFLHENPGKTSVFETISPFRKARRYFSVRQKGPKLQVVSVPATSDLVNILTLGLIATGIGIIGHTGLPFFLMVYGVLLLDLASRLFTTESALRRNLTHFLS